VAYTGTHDTPTFLEFFTQASPPVRDFTRRYLRLREDEGLGWGALAGVWGSPAGLAIAPMQDVLGLGGDARMNTPGTVGPENWSWRVRQEALNDGVAYHLRLLTATYGRLA
jgi:4-alpha-glucanotransferase